MAKRIEFDPPKDWSPPEGKDSPGDEPEVLATVRIKKGGRLCLVALDGKRLPGYSDDEDDGKTYPEAVAEHMDKGY